MMERREFLEGAARLFLGSVGMFFVGSSVAGCSQTDNKLGEKTAELTSDAGPKEIASEQPITEAVTGIQEQIRQLNLAIKKGLRWCENNRLELFKEKQGSLQWWIAITQELQGKHGASLQTRSSVAELVRKGLTENNALTALVLLSIDNKSKDRLPQATRGILLQYAMRDNQVNSIDDMLRSSFQGEDQTALWEKLNKGAAEEKEGVEQTATRELGALAIFFLQMHNENYAKQGRKWLEDHLASTEEKKLTTEEAVFGLLAMSVVPPSRCRELDLPVWTKPQQQLATTYVDQILKAAEADGTYQGVQGSEEAGTYLRTAQATCALQYYVNAIAG